jgi:transcription elongation factor SPT6
MSHSGLDEFIDREDDITNTAEPKESSNPNAEDEASDKLVTTLSGNNKRKLNESPTRDISVADEDRHEAVDDKNNNESQFKSQTAPMPKKKKTKKDFSRFVETDVDVSDDGEEVSDDEEEEEDDEYVRDGFVVGDDEEEEEEDKQDDSDDENLFETVSKIKKKKRHNRLKKRTDDVVLDVDDYDLIEDNLKNNYSDRPSFNDLRKQREQEDYAEEDENSQFVSKSNKDRLDRFVDDKNETGQYAEDDDYDDNWIEDDDYDELEVEGKQRKERITTATSGMRRGASKDQYLEALEIFGEDYDVDMEGEDNLMEADMGEVSEVIKEKRRKNILSKIERIELIESFCTETDEEIRQTDRPERFQQIMESRDLPEATERKEESNWMAPKLCHYLLDRGYDIDSYILEGEILPYVELVLEYYQVFYCNLW